MDRMGKGPAVRRAISAEKERGNQDWGIDGSLHERVEEEEGRHPIRRSTAKHTPGESNDVKDKQSLTRFWETATSLLSRQQVQEKTQRPCSSLKS
jgi:hypothetical protein